jgi:predicted metal-dependent phosphoesterase TrpH
MKYDLHIHSKYSGDSFLSPAAIIKIAKYKGLQGVAITDHGTIRGGLEAQKINKDKDFEVIVGAEIKTEYGDILGLFLQNEIVSTKFNEVIAAIKAQNGISVLAHPYRHYKQPEIIIDKVDLIEGFNARSKKIHNGKSYNLANKYKKPMVAGSDAHLFWEIGRGITTVNHEMREAININDIQIEGHSSCYYFVHGLSVLTEKIRFYLNI